MKLYARMKRKNLLKCIKKQTSHEKALQFVMPSSDWQGSVLQFKFESFNFLPLDILSLPGQNTLCIAQALHHHASLYLSN